MLTENRGLQMINQQKMATISAYEKLTVKERQNRFFLMKHLNGQK